MQLHPIQFGDFDPIFTAYDTAGIVLLPVPYDGTSTWMKGADRGPDALLEASYNLEFFDLETETEVFKRGICTVEAVNENTSPEAMSACVAEKVALLLSEGKFPVVIGGEHSVSIGAIQAAATHYPNLTVLQLDAHSDMRSEYHGSQYNHACVMARAREVAQVTQVGIRSSDVSERVFIDPERIFYAHRIKAADNWYNRVSEQLTQEVYLTIDLDVFDPAFFPATGTPEPDGLSYREVIRLVNEVAAKHRIVGLDLVELCPHPAHRASDFFAAKLLYQLLSIIFTHRN